MQHKTADQERSEMIMKIYFQDIHKINAGDIIFPASVIQVIEDFIKLN